MGSRRRVASGGVSVLCVGQATLDHVLAIGDDLVVGRKHRADDHHVVGGGLAANAAVTVARLGGSATLVSSIGDDDTGEVVIAGLLAEGVDTCLVQRARGLDTPFSAVIVSAEGTRTIVNHSAAELFECSCPDLEAVDCDAVLVDGRWPAGSRDALTLARRRNVPGVVDVDRSVADGECRRTLFGLASHLVFSEDALCDITGGSSPADGLRRVARDTGAHVSVTLGERGVVWLDGDDIRSLDAFDVAVVDTAGAGDAFHGAFALSLGEGAGEETAFRFAAAAAALKCTRHGARAGIPDRAAVEELLVRRAAPIGVAVP